MPIRPPMLYSKKLFQHFIKVIGTGMLRAALRPAARLAGKL
jgi:hypothetical protein